MNNLDSKIMLYIFDNMQAKLKRVNVCQGTLFNMQNKSMFPIIQITSNVHKLNIVESILHIKRHFVLFLSSTTPILHI